MADIFSKQKRSAVMAAIRSKGNRSTEGVILLLLKREKIKGWRRHLKLPGTPDFAFPRAKLAVFTDGCYWHGCPRCYHGTKTNRSFWRNKISRNRKRDLAVTCELRKRGWSVVRFWECRLKDAAGVLRRLQKGLKMAERPITEKNHQRI